MNRTIYRKVARKYCTTVPEVKKEIKHYLEFSHILKPHGTKPMTPDEAIQYGLKSYLLITAKLKQMENNT